MDYLTINFINKVIWERIGVIYNIKPRRVPGLAVCDTVHTAVLQKVFRTISHNMIGYKSTFFVQALPEEDHGRNISVKFHQNPMSSFREEDVLKKG